MISVKDLVKTFPGAKGEVRALNGVSFEVGKGELFTLLGPSGCGKTTTLRCIAGLEQPVGGEIVINDRAVFRAADGTFVPPERRQIGMVFQSYAIWPHMTVFKNVAYPLAGGNGRDDVNQRVGSVLDRLSLGSLADRLAPNLSGGQQQRVALARALVAQPQVLLLDEPLSNLDAKLREQMRFELKSLQESFGITTVYVTHDQEEALALSDRIGLMHEGMLLEVGTPDASCIFGRHTGSPPIFSARQILSPVKSSCREMQLGMKCYWIRPSADSPRGAVSNGSRAWRRSCFSVRKVSSWWMETELTARRIAVPLWLSG